MNQVESGKTLAQIAKAQGKTSAGLAQAIRNAAKARLDKAVAAGRITRAQEREMLSGLNAKLNALINRTAPRFAHPVPLAPWVPGGHGPGPGSAGASPGAPWPHPGSFVPPRGDPRIA
jgi:hypothetical protein